MGANKVYDGEKNKWKVILIKTIDDTEPIVYRLVNIGTFETIDVPAYRILDEFTYSGDKIITNVKCKHNSVTIVDDSGYNSIDECIMVDIENTDVENIYEWSLTHDRVGQQIINSFDNDENKISPRNIRIDDRNKIVWTCDKHHSIKCEFAAYYSLGGKCPICEAINNKARVSLRYWGDLTDNKDIVRYFDTSQYNELYSSNIPFDSKSKVYFEGDNGECSKMSLYDVTVKRMEPFEVKRETVNLTRMRPKHR